MVQVNWTKEAVEDLEQIGSYISIESIYYAQVQLDRFIEATKILEKHPEYGKPVPEVNSVDIREILVGSYRIIYRIKTDLIVDILTIHHSRRTLDKSLFVWFQ